MADRTVPILIVGAGGCGLSASNFLSNLGVETLLIEKHPTPAIVPKARYLNQRVMEIFRQHGIADQIYARAIPLKHFGKVIWRTSLSGDAALDRKTFFEMESFGGGSLMPTYMNDSPCLSSLFSQVRMEPLLKAEAEKRAPQAVLYGHELISFEQDAEGVSARVRKLADQSEFTVRAQYMWAADAGKTINPILGARMSGTADMADIVTVYFKADLSQHWDDDYAMTMWFVNPEGASWSSGVLGQLGPKNYGRLSEEWVFHFSFNPADQARFDESKLVPRMRELLKLPDLKPEILNIAHWNVNGMLVDRYRWGRVFLGGDAAHRHPPTTGLGLNSAIQDAHNIAWKFKKVLGGEAPDALLDSYESERRPVAQRNIEWALMTYQNHGLTDGAIGVVRGNRERSENNFRALFADTADGRARRAVLNQVMKVQAMEFQAHDLEIGYRYAQGALTPEDTPHVQDPWGQHYTPTTLPGCRLPHAWLSSDGQLDISTLDVVRDDRPVLIVDGKAQAWRAAAAAASAKLGSEVLVVAVGAQGDFQDRDGKWASLREVGPEGAVLVRPDQHVAWRAMTLPDDPAEALTGALAAVLGRGTSISPTIRQKKEAIA